MEAKDLRIGNWFLGDCTEGKFHQITANEILDFYDDPLDDYYQPIPLTEEWLLKFGAKKFNNALLIDRFRLIPRLEYSFYQVVCKETNSYFSKVEFVHEWQNLYFAMNGKELTLKN